MEDLGVVVRCLSLNSLCVSSSSSSVSVRVKSVLRDSETGAPRSQSST